MTEPARATNTMHFFHVPHSVTRLPRRITTHCIACCRAEAAVATWSSAVKHAATASAALAAAEKLQAAQRQHMHAMHYLVALLAHESNDVRRACAAALVPLVPMA